MSSVSEREWQLASDLATARISEGKFCEALSITVEGASAFSLEMLRGAAGCRDADAVEFGLYLGHRFGFEQEHLGVLLQLAGEDWHAQHQNVVDGLAKLRAPSSVETLYRIALARFEYLDYDEAFALGVKCIWALGGIETDAAVARLGDLLSCENSILEENAAEQLTRIQIKGGTQTLREAAGRALGRRGRS